MSFEEPAPGAPLAARRAALVPLLRDAVLGADARGRLRETDARALRHALLDPDLLGEIAADPPGELLGTWDALPEHVRMNLRRRIEDDIRATMDLYPRGALWTGTARTLHRVAEDHHLPGPVRRSAGMWAARLWKRPARSRADLLRAARARRWRHESHPELLHLVAALGHDPGWLTAGFAEQIPVDPRCRGFHHDRARNVVYGYLLGIDLVETPDGVVCHESNLNAGLSAELRRPYFGQDPIPRGLADLAQDLGLRRVVWVGADLAPLDPWLHEQLWACMRERGLDLEVLEDARLPSRPLPPGVPHPRRTLLPPLDPPNDSLVVRLRSYRTGSDVLVSRKEAVTASMTRELERSGDRRVRMLPLSADPGPVALPSDPGFPNLVYKYPATDRGSGVHFLRAVSREHARELARSIDAVSGERGGRFQPWVCSTLTPERTFSEYRGVIVVTPLGARCLSARRRQSVHPIPTELPAGVVRDRKPFINTGFFGNVSGERIPRDEAVIEEAATAFAERMSAYLRRTFVWQEEAPDAVS